MKNTYLNKIRGCIVGGAAGDVLGYPVEPFHENQIRQIYGKDGIIAHQCPIGHNRAIVSDDTQMTMFTATGLIEAYKNPSPGKTVVGHVYDHYRDWLHTQDPTETGSGKSWLRNVPELNARRGPGYTCLKALKSGRCGTREEPLNPSKGCGGVMRVAPVALCIGRDEKFLSLEELEELDLTGADTAAITHGHPLGYIPAAALVHVINRIVYGNCTLGDSLHDIVAECRMAMETLFKGEGYLPDFLEILDKAVELSGNAVSDSKNIRELGGGWTGEEAFAIAIYCTLRYHNDFSKAIIAAVNHSGDSDSTGAITGNIVGAAVGYEGIDGKWKQHLEFGALLVGLASELLIS